MNWLKDYQTIADEITYLEFNLERTEKELKRWESGDLSHIRLERDSRGANVEEEIIKIKNELALKLEQKEKIIAIVETFQGIENKILRLKYIEGFTLDEIADQLNFSTSYIYKKHAALIRLLKYVDKNK